MKNRRQLAPLWFAWILPAIAAAAAACSSGDNGPSAAPSEDAGASDDTSSDGADGGTDGAIAEAKVEWTPCPLHSEGKGPQVSCATIQVPLDRAHPEGKTIPFYVKRFRPEGGKGERALWMLQGGPGASGYVYENIAEAMATRFPDVDYYIPDHRGTGQSARLGCPLQEAADSEAGLYITDEEWVTCLADIKAKHGDDLKFYDTTNAANDLGVAIARINKEKQPTFVLGVSYGTYWAHRYLQIFPGQADGIVLDSIFPPGGSLARQDADSDEAARDFMEVCKKDAFCGGKLGADPWAKAQALVAKLKSGHCPAIALPDFPTEALLRQLFASLLMDPTFRVYIPAVIYRADRCEERDVTALKKFIATMTQPQPESDMMKQWGWGLSYNIIFSELWETPPPSEADLESIRENAVASRDITGQMGVLYSQWPRYTPDPSTRTFAESDTPMLFLQGGLDPATLLRKARPMRDHFTKPHQTWVEIPTASHTAFGSSTTKEGRSCGTKMIMAFLENPTAAVDTSCIGDIIPLDFQATKLTAYNNAFFGSNDIWE